MKKIPLLFVFFFSVACGTLQDLSQGEPNQNISGTEAVFLFATDYSSSGQLLSADFDSIGSLTNSGVTNLGSSGVLRLYDGRLYLLSDGFSNGSSDNVQVLDPSNGYATVNQWSTGNGTNPQDIIVINNKAYISLLNGEGDEENIDEEGNPGDLIIMDLDTGNITRRISFHDYLHADGDLNADAEQMVLAGNTLYVVVQDLQNDFSPNTSGKVAIIDTTNDTLSSVITLQGRNPFDIAYSPTANKLYISEAEYVDRSTDFGGVEIVDLATLQSLALLPDEDLGGYVERVVCADGKVFAVVSQLSETEYTSNVLVMDEDNIDVSGVTDFVTGGQDIREVVADSSHRLWVARRVSTSTNTSDANSEVDVFDIETGVQVGSSLIPPAAVTSIVFGIFL